MNKKMTKDKDLALMGGKKSITWPFAKYNPIGSAELKAATEVIESGVLSQYLGVWHDDFYGGPKVREFEKLCKQYFNVKHAVTVNSWSSGLIAAVGAIGIEPGDEVIVSPWTMCASATAILHWNAIPVFADIEAETFNLDPNSVLANITPYTKAIIATDIFGHSADIDALMQIANNYGLKLISDTAQSPGALYNGKFAGTISHVGGFSLNYHKHVHTGEGGIIVTNDDRIAQRLQLIRNHAEAVVGEMEIQDIDNMIGYNFRLGEIECAIGIEQLNKLSKLLDARQKTAAYLGTLLSGLPYLRLPVVKSGCTHAYYSYPMLFDELNAGVKSADIVRALKAEGVPINDKYQNIHLLPMYQNKIAYGKIGFPWNADFCKREVNYEKGICPTAEKLNSSGYLALNMCSYNYSETDVEAIASAFNKVWAAIVIK